MNKPLLRCSQLPQLLSCPGSRTLMALVKARDGDEGHEGTTLHWRIASKLIKDHDAFEPDQFGQESNASVFEGYVLPKMSEWMIDWAIRVVQEQIPATFNLAVEEVFEHEFDRFILTGHMDVRGINGAGTEFVGGDWKTGYKPAVVAELNDQILGYLALAKCAWSTLEKAKFFVGQPRNSEEDGFPRVSTVELEGDALDACVAGLEARVNAALDDAMTVNSGLLQCAWCPVGLIHKCPAQMKDLDFMKATITPEYLTSLKATADDAGLGDIVIAARTLRRSIEDAETLLKERIAANGAVIAGQGTRITAKEEGGQYSITNPEGAFAAVKTLIPEARIPHVLKYSTDRLIDEIAVAADVPKGGKAATTAKSIFDAVVRPNMEQGKRVMLIFS